MSQTITAVRSDAPKSTHQKRLDIQGLRAVAVLVVVANHLTGSPVGGFVGVDVFFVISGFLITSLLLREHAKTGRISFVDFYKRRIRRIMPVALLAIVVTIAASYATYRTGRATAILHDGIWSLLFAGNWRFAIVGTDYWNADGAVSPLQHYWSLGVEEQFYFVWPVVIAVVLALATSIASPERGLGVLRLAILAIILASFLWALYETSSSAGFAYFSTFSRAWELGAGALLALTVSYLKRIPRTLRPVLAWVGILGIVISVVFLRGEVFFPAPLALLPVASTSLIIAAGTGGDQRFLAPLTNKVSSYLGDISYSLYLWHFPVIILVGEFLPKDDWFTDLLMFATMLGVSALSYHLVEDRIRRSNWLEPKSKRKGRRNPATNDGLKYVGLVGLALVTAAVTVFAMTPRDIQGEARLAVTGTPPSLPAAESTETNQQRLGGKLQAALAKETWPELSPSIDNVLTEGRPDEDALGCAKTLVSDPSSCNFDVGAEKSAVVYGDSTAITLLPTLRAAIGKDYNIRGMSMAGCITWDIKVKVGDGAKQASCDEFKVNAVAEIVDKKPDVVFLTNTSAAAYELASGGSVTSGSAEMEDGARSVLERLSESGAKVIVIAAPPTGLPLATCATRTSTPADCEYEVNPGYGVASAAAKKAAAATGSAYIDTLPWFCVNSKNCPSFVDSTPVKRDGNHTTKQYAVMLAPTFLDAFSAVMNP